MNSDQREIQRKLRVLEHADGIGDVSKACRYFGIGRASFYRWRKAYMDKGDVGLTVTRSVPHNHPNKMSPEVEEKILHLRRTYHPGSSGTWSAITPSKFQTQVSIAPSSVTA